MLIRLEMIGNLGGEPEMRYTTAGTPITSFNVAANETWTGKDWQKQQRTTWVRVSAWGQLAEICAKWLHKGDRVFVEGRPSARGWSDKNSGEARASLELTASTVRFLSTQSGDASGGHADEEIGSSAQADIPF